MKNEGVVFCKKYIDYLGEEREAFQVTIQGNAFDYLYTIEALLNILGATPDDFDSQVDRRNICDLIKHMLPSLDQIEILENLQRTNTK